MIPHIRVAQSTSEMNWNDVELRVFSTDGSPVTGLFSLPQGSRQSLRLETEQGGFVMKNDPLPGKVRWQIRRFETRLSPASQDE